MHRVATLALVAACSHPPSAPRTAPARTQLVVLIVVDQLSAWAFERDRSQFTGGFARLLREGGYVRDGELPYANTFTAPGHASIGTGTPPSVHGIVGNTWFRRGEARERDAEYDPAASVLRVGISHGGDLAGETGSASALRVDGIADALRRQHPTARSIAIGLKARAASFVVGKRPELAVWYDPAAGGMTTSRGYASAAPDWLVTLATTKPASRFFTQSWTPLDAGRLARMTGIADDAPGEGDAARLGVAFPHDLGASDAPAKAMLHTPFADEIVFDAAIASLDAMQLGADDVPDLLAICFNAHDFAGHLWGPDSWETVDLTLRLDALLGRLFDTLDARLGKAGWAVVLTSDHGITPIVDRSHRGRRITTIELRDAIAPGIGVLDVISGNVYLDKPDEAALASATAALAKVPNIAAAARTDQIAGHCETRTGLDRALCYSIVDGESGDIMVVPAAGSLITDYKTGTHHDAPFADNRHVPILVMAPGLSPRTGTGTILQIAPTVAALLGISPPATATSGPLFGL
ncbi:MAG: alkaline phosphatase family protein [Kofleriaceae bacterium]